MLDLTSYSGDHEEFICNIMPCSPVKVSRRFGGTYRLRLQGRKIRRTRNQRDSGWQAELLRNVGWLSTDYTALYQHLLASLCLSEWNNSAPNGWYFVTGTLIISVNIIKFRLKSDKKQTVYIKIQMRFWGVPLPVSCPTAECTLGLLWG
jgi:hypothetical protein